MKIVTILGARPQFIKAGSVSREINHQIQLGTDIQEVIIHTGQHYDKNMSDSFFDDFNFEPSDSENAHLTAKSIASQVIDIINFNGVITDITLRAQRLEIKKK